jgi:hypothetical protein
MTTIITGAVLPISTNAVDSRAPMAMLRLWILADIHSTAVHKLRRTESRLLRPPNVEDQSCRIGVRDWATDPIENKKKSQKSNCAAFSAAGLFVRRSAVVQKWKNAAKNSTFMTAARKLSTEDRP